MKKYSTYIKILGLTLITLFAFSSAALAQTKEVQKAIEETKESVDELIEAKDENSPLDLGLRIETFKKAVDLSIAEAKDLKVKLIAHDDIEDEDFITWKEETLNSLNESIDYYGKFKEYTEVNKNRLDKETVQDIALQFKEEREEKFLETNEKVRDFLLIEKSKNTIEITNERWEKINKDLETLQELEIIDEDSDLWSLLNQSKEFIDESLLLIEEAENNFYEQEIKNTIPDNLELSIKDDLVTSLDKMRSTYQVFIEMSNLVRELLS